MLNLDQQERLTIKLRSKKKSAALTDNEEFLPAGFFVFRTPLLPFAEFLNWSNGLEAPSVMYEQPQFEQALERDRKTLRERLFLMAQKPIVREAIFIASPNIIERFHLWTDNPDSERGRKIENVLVRYLSRMTGRATPFGLFAGCSVGTIHDQTRLTIGKRATYQRHSRLDMDYLFALTNAIVGKPELRSSLRYTINPSLYRAAGRVRYVESRLDDKARSYHLVAIEETEYLKNALLVSKAGATFEVVAKALVDGEISLSEAEDYVTQLIESQILVPDISLTVTGPQPIYPLLSQLKANKETSPFASTLASVETSLNEIDQSGLGVKTERYLALAEVLESLPAKPELSRLFQVDMVKPAHDATIGKSVLTEIIRGVNLLHDLAPIEQRSQSALNRFRDAFVNRYETREVPLAEALDEEVGIGFGVSEESSPLLKDLGFPDVPEEVTFDPTRHKILLRKLSEAIELGVDEITIDSSEIGTIKSKKPLALPDSFSVNARLSAESQLALDQGDFLVLIESVYGPSGAVMMGRFCHADQALHARVKSLLQAEEALNPLADFAEIVHLPEGRVGNVIARPVLRTKEIPYLGRSGLPHDSQFPITDIYVSVADDQIRLRSQRTGREIIPRMTNAHNYSARGLGVYRFLCMLQRQGTIENLWWDWGALSSAPFLPRVRCGRLVLSLACWHLNKDELRGLAQTNCPGRFRAVQQLRVARRFPRLVAVAEDDNLLVVDLDNVLSVESFVQLIKGQEGATLKEIFPAPENLCAFGPEGRFVHELIVPFTKTPRAKVEEHQSNIIDKVVRLPRNVSSGSRDFPPGSEWLYAKVYTGTATADTILKDTIRPLTESLLQANIIDQWFFIRYADPDWHLRLRFHAVRDKIKHHGYLAIQSALNRLLDEGLLWRVQFDTYQREVERYGGTEGIVLAEKLFYFDSEAVLEIIEMLEPGDEGADERWRLALSGIDRLLSDLGFDLQRKYWLVTQAQKSFETQHRVDKILQGQLSEKYRRERKNLENALESDSAEGHPLSPGFEVFRRRSEQLSPVVSELRNLERTGKLSATVQNLALSYIHMHANRLLRSAQRQQELVLYFLLSRFYESQVNRRLEKGWYERTRSTVD